MNDREAGYVPRYSTPVNAVLQVMSVLFAVASVWPAVVAHAESAPGSRTDRPIALVGGMLLDGYEAAPIHDAVVVIGMDQDCTGFIHNFLRSSFATFLVRRTQPHLAAVALHRRTFHILHSLRHHDVRLYPSKLRREGNRLTMIAR